MKRNSYPRTGQELETAAFSVGSEVFGLDLHSMPPAERIAMVLQMREVVRERMMSVLPEVLESNSLFSDPRYRALNNQNSVLEAYLLECGGKIGKSPDDISQLVSRTSKFSFELSIYFD